MAQSLLLTISAKKGSKIARRALRLFKQVPGADKSLTQKLEAANGEIEIKMAALEKAKDEKDHCYDMVQFRDVELDNAVRDAAEACKKIDRDNMGSQLFSTIFPDNVTAVVETYFKDEPAEVKKIISRIQNLGADHPLKAQADKLSEVVAQSDFAIRELNDSMIKEASCQVDLEVSRNNLVKTYNNLILDAIKAYGRKNANKLFPQIRGSSSGSDDEDDTSDDSNGPQASV